MNGCASVVGSCLAVLLSIWAGRLFGPLGALAALWLAVFDPTLLAHGKQVTHTFTTARDDHSVGLRVTDTSGDSATARQDIKVTNPAPTGSIAGGWNISSEGSS